MGLDAAMEGSIGTSGLDFTCGVYDGYSGFQGNSESPIREAVSPDPC